MDCRIGWVVVVVALSFGCRGEQTSQPTQANSTTQGVAATDDERPTFAATDSLVIPGQDNKLLKEIERLSGLAQVAQSNWDFTTEAEHWKTVHGLLSQQFGADSWQARNADLTAKTALRHAAMNDEQRQDLRELLEWQSRIAEFLRQGNPQAALTLALGSVDRTLDLYGENSYMHGKQLIQIARLEQLSGRLQESIESYRQAFATISPAVGRLHPELESIHAHLGEVWLALDDRGQAMENLRVALRMSTELFGGTSLQVATRSNDLAVIMQQAGNAKEAIPYLEKALTLRQQWLGEAHPHVAHCRVNLGTCYLDLKQFDAAQRELENALPALQNAAAGPHRLLADCLHKLAIAHMMQNQPERAEPHLASLVALLKQTSIGEVELGNAEYRWGVSLAKQGKYEDAEPVLKLSLARLENALGVRHPQAEKPREALLQMYLATRRTADAEALKSSVQPASFESADPKFVREPQLNR